MAFRSLPEIIAAKRDGAALPGDELRELIARYTRGEVPDYQMAAWAMAVLFRGMNEEEMVALTLAMRDSGRVLDFGDIPGRKIDKHSTGGVGDKVSICLAPLVAACGVKVPMVSGRGLGHTGGTLDKLEAIPGFSVQLSTERFHDLVRDLGVAMCGQTRDLAPADKKLYALRDVTATVESIPLIVASILSKKLAEGIDGLVLDVKVGRGAFMKSEQEARALAENLVRVTRGAGKDCVALLTSMDAPLGRAVGNANETHEAFEILHGRGPDDLLECTLVLGAEMLVLGHVAKTLEAAREQLRTAIRTGSALETARKMVEAHGGDPRVVDEPARLPSTLNRRPLRAARSGWLSDVDALAVGRAAVVLGAGRTKSEDGVDPAVGFYFDKVLGDSVEAGEPLVWVHSDVEARAEEALQRLSQALHIGDEAPVRRPLVLGRVG